MRMWVQHASGVHLFGPGTAASVLAHVALISGAVAGSGRPSAVPPPLVTERVFYLPPPDRRPSASPIPERVRYLSAHAGLGEQQADRAHPGGVTPRSSDAARVVGHLGPDETLHAAPLPAPPAVDSVYSILGADQTARVDASAAPVYPAALIEQRLEGSVQARYVIDTTGRADATSVEILHTTHPAFAEAVREAIPLMRFSPAMVAGRHVRQMVEQDFTFKLALPPAAVAPTAPEHTRARPVP